MHYQFTSGAERVLYYAAGCTSPADYAELAGPAILLGLLAEAECRAALLLAPHGITWESVCKHWPGLLAPPPNSGIPTAPLTTFTHEIEQLLQMVFQITDEHVHPPMIATEHLLLSLLMADNELTRWLSEQGVRLETIEADVRKRHGYQSGPLPIETSPFDTLSEEELQIEKYKTADSGQWAVRRRRSGQCETASGCIVLFIPHPSSFILSPVQPKGSKR